MIKHVTFDVSPLNDNVTFNVQNVCVIPDIPADVPADSITLDDYPHLAALPLSPVTIECQSRPTHWTRPIRFVGSPGNLSIGE